MTHPNARQDEVAREARRARVAALVLAGVRDQTRIAEQLGVSQPTIGRDIKALEARWAVEAVQDIAAAKGLDLERLDRLISAHWSGALKGNATDTDRVIDLMQHRAKLLGLEAPKNINIRHEVQRLVDQVAAEDGMTDAERADLITAVTRHLAEVKT